MTKSYQVWTKDENGDWFLALETARYTEAFETAELMSMDGVESKIVIVEGKL